METHLRAELVLAALEMAVARRKPGEVIHHSDQGCQYTSTAFGNRCQALGVRPSMGSVGDAYDNAMAESFLATLEFELLDRKRFQTQVEARMTVFEWIEAWYNPRRRHSAIGYLSPVEFERRPRRESGAGASPPFHGMERSRPKSRRASGRFPKAPNCPRESGNSNSTSAEKPRVVCGLGDCARVDIGDTGNEFEALNWVGLLVATRLLRRAWRGDLGMAPLGRWCSAREAEFALALLELCLERIVLASAPSYR